jgi:hypothetical protein
MPPLTPLHDQSREAASFNKTDAGNGSKAICRVSNASRSPSPDPSRSAAKMNIPTDIATAITELLTLESQQVGRTIPRGEWDTLHPVVGAVFPDWYRDLMANYPLAGREFDIDEDGFYQGKMVSVNES